MPRNDPQELFANEIVLREWWILQSAAGAFTAPDNIPGDANWIFAGSAGTVAEILREYGQWTLEQPAPLHDSDFWYRVQLDGQGRRIVRFDGLATIAEIWFRGKKIADSSNMFLPLEVAVELSGPEFLHICFRSLNAHMRGLKGKRARWRTALVENQNLRFVRTSFLGHMHGWCPPVDIAGPYRPVTLRNADVLSARDVHVRSAYRDGVGTLTVEISGAAAVEGMKLHCGGYSAVLARDGGVFRLELSGDFEPWQVHTHGQPNLHEAVLECDGARLEIGKIGFRSVSVDRGPDGSRFFIHVNGQRVFARGVCWTPPDIVSLGCDPQVYRQRFELLRDAGINLLRVPGITLYEAPEFYRLADEFGILVWQDLQLANFDYPFADDVFRKSLEAEVNSFLDTTSRYCSLAIVCGGSEILQQAAMLGMPQAIWSVDYLARDLPALVALSNSNVAYVVNSPSGGELPFFVNAGVGHYYGVGAYMRPLEDARRADVAFAGECLAFANVPDQVTLDRHLKVPPAQHPLWKARVPRDRGASWDFEDVREFYMTHLFGVDCARLRREEPRRYLDYARAAPAEAMEATFAEWRRPQSRNGGGLVFLWQDFLPGAGWGIIDSTGRPKSVFYALKRSFAPLQLILSDEGVNGLHVHVVNEGDKALNLTLEIECLANGKASIAFGRNSLYVRACGSSSTTATEILGAFFDVNYAYRFGPPAHDVVVARLYGSDGDILQEAFHLPLGRGRRFAEPGLEATFEETTQVLTISADRFAQNVAIACEDLLPADNYFHLAPGRPKRVKFAGDLNQTSRPQIRISALNSAQAINL